MTRIAISASGVIVTYGLSSALAVFVPSSASSGTNWVGVFGSEGYDLAGWGGESDVSNLPNASVSLVKGSRVVWAANTADARALMSPNGLTRTAAGYYDPTELQVKLTFHEAYTGNLRLYAVDWSQGGSKENETITVGSSKASLSNNPDMGSHGFSEGQWSIFPISEPAGGSLTITVTGNSWPTGALLSGIFLGDPPPTASSAPQRTWVNTVGSAGYAWRPGTVRPTSPTCPTRASSLTQGSR